jgi:hypothetical protein
MKITPITTIGLYNRPQMTKTTQNKTLTFEGRKSALPKMCYFPNGSTLSEAAKAERKLYGTTSISGKLVEKVTPRLQEMGYEKFKPKYFRDLWIFKTPRYSEGYHIVSFYDSKNDASILLTEDSSKAYMVKYKRAKTAYAEPLQAYYTKEYDFKTKMWRDVDPKNFTPEAPFCYED